MVVCRRDGIRVGLTDSREVGFLVEVGVVVGLKVGLNERFVGRRDGIRVGLTVGVGAVVVG